MMAQTCCRCDQPAFVYAGHDAFCALHAMEFMLEREKDPEIIARIEEAIEEERARR